MLDAADRLVGKLLHPWTEFVCRFLGWTNFRLARVLFIVAGVNGVDFTVHEKESAWFRALIVLFWLSLVYHRLKDIQEIETHRGETDAITLTKGESRIIWDRRFFLAFVPFGLLDVVIAPNTWDLALLLLIWAGHAATDYDAGGKTYWAMAWDKLKSIQLPSLLPTPAPIPA